MTNKQVITGRVAQGEAGKSLLAFLSMQAAGAFSAKALKKAIDARQCRINGAVEYFSTHKLRIGDVVHLDMMLDKEPARAPSVIYEDEYLIVCNKPEGVVSDEKTLPFKGCRLVHRLDKDTSGALILARSLPIYEKLCEQFRAREIKKFYLAIVDGLVENHKGKIENFLVKIGHYQGQNIWGISRTEKGLHALTHWKLIKTLDKASLLSCQPVTGRTHQLRVHLKEMGHPILGDHQYARRFCHSFRGGRHLLHAERVVMQHPITKVLLDITAPLERKDMLEVLK